MGQDILPYGNERTTGAPDMWWSANGQVHGEYVCSMNSHLETGRGQVWLDRFDQ